MTIRLTQDGNINMIQSGDTTASNTLADIRITNMGSTSTSGTSYMTITTSGNIGIGTTAPGNKLHVMGTGSLDDTIQSIGTTNGNIVMTATVPHNNSSIKGYGLITGILGTGLTWMQSKYLDQIGTTLPMSLQPLGGNVGIGTSSPSDILDVNGKISNRGSDGFGYAKLSKAGTSNTGFVEFYNANDTRMGYFGYGDTSTFNFIVEQARDIKISTNNSERMRITSSGNVGIGTNSPTTILTIKKPIDSVAYGAGTRMIDFKSYMTGFDEETIKAAIYAGVGTGRTDNGYLSLMTANENVLYNRLHITQTGNVGIGTTSPDQKVHIDTSGANPPYNIHLSGNGKQTALVYIGNLSDANNAGWSGSSAQMFITSSFSNNRSINARGTLNASGADYAEYMTKAGEFEIAKGEIAGVNASGKITKTFSEAVSFVVKSTDPCMVGGDVWGTEQRIGEKPTPPATDASEEENAAYENALRAWNAALESERQKVDRMSYCGQTPVNVYNSTPGDYIIPIENSDGTIGGQAISESSITFEQYRKSVGKVIKVLEDGRAYIIVKIL